MIRKYNDKVVKLIKVMLSKGYKCSSIIDIMKNEYGVEISSTILQSMSRCDSYADVCPYLNDNIMRISNYNTTIESKKVTEIKWAISNDYSDEEIMHVFNISRKVLTSIRMCKAPYFNIAPEFNIIIQEKCPRKKKVNINRKIVIEIKKEFIANEGHILLKDIATKHGLNSGTVSNVISLKTYQSFGISFNSKILKIRREKEKKKQEREKLLRIKNKEKEKLSILIGDKNKLISSIL
jgi:predicted DNA-binding protein YlxM (UPF0122 family)